MARPQDLHGYTKRIKTGCGWLYITINEHENKPFEIFIRLGKAGNCASAWTEALGRMVSLALRNGATQADITHHLTGISCNTPTPACKSCIDGVASILSKNKEPSPPLVEKVADKTDTMLALLANNGEITGDRGKW